jgi:hypothetical protein
MAKPKVTVINMETGEVVEEREDSMMLLPPPPGHCRICGTRHDPDDPHDATSLFWGMRFRMRYGRDGTWADACAHLPEPALCGCLDLPISNPPPVRMPRRQLVRLNGSGSRVSFAPTRARVSVGRVDPGTLLPLALDPSQILLRQGLTPDPWERDLLLSSKRQILLNCSRQAGKSTTTAALAVHSIRKGNNDIQAGSAAVHARIQTGRLKVVKHRCPNLIAANYRCLEPLVCQITAGCSLARLANLGDDTVEQALGDVQGAASWNRARPV